MYGGNNPQRIGLSLLAAVSIAVALRAALDVHIARAVFPSWFPTTFLLATAAICAYALAIAVSLLLRFTPRQRAAWVTRAAVARALFPPNDDCASAFNSWWIATPVFSFGHILRFIW